MRDLHRRFAFSAFSLVVALGCCTARTQAATSQQVSDALEKGKAYLYTQQKNGTWEETMTQPPDATMIKEIQSIKGGQWTGQTALAVYALLSAGEKPQSEKLAPAIDFLKKNPTAGVYALGIRMQVWLMLPRTPDVMAAAKRDTDMLKKLVKTEGSALGMYDYAPRPGKDYSHSRSQYGVLGMWAAEQMGLEVDDRYWQVVEKAWIDHQAPDGGWTYKKVGETDNPITPGMTAVGVATLFITQDYTRATEGLACKGNLGNPSIDRGLKWMGDNMGKVATDQRYERDFPNITLYAVERIGVAAGVKYLGGVDWYQKGAGWLVGKQNAKTGAIAAGGGFGSGGVVDTSFAMLFLARGRAPIAFNKLDYSKGVSGPQAPAWNQRPRDIANLVGWIGRSVEQNLNWQVVPATAPLTDLIDAPILYITGSKAPDLDDEQKARLREYVHAGGMIVGNSDCGNIAFSTGFRKLANELFPTYELRELPQEHPLYNGVFRRDKWKVKPSIQGLSNGSRELMLLIPQADVSRTWQSKIVGGKEDFWQLGGALFLYVSEGKDLRYRGENHLIFANKNIKPNRSLTLHRLQHTQNWNPEPGGWQRMANYVLNNHRIGLKVEELKLGAGKLPTNGIAHLTGTGKTTLTDAQREEIKKFVEGGGLLLVDAAGGDGGFADSMDRELGTMFGAGFQILPETHPLFSPGGKAIDIRYRNSARKVITGGLKAPRMKGVEINGKLGVVFSREDLSTGIVGQSVDGIIGYDPDTATSLVGAVLLYKAGPDPEANKPTTGPTTGPTTKSTTKPTKSTSKTSTKKPTTKPAADQAPGAKPAAK